MCVVAGAGFLGWVARRGGGRDWVARGGVFVFDWLLDVRRAAVAVKWLVASVSRCCFECHNLSFFVVHN